MQIKFLPPAQRELDAAVNYYNKEQPELGDAFLNEVLKSLELIGELPLAWPKLSRRTRRCIIKQFPYYLVYQVRQEEIIIVAIAHFHRQPNYWNDRL